MLFGRFSVLLSLCGGLALARPWSRSPKELRQRQEVPVEDESTICGQIIEQVNNGYFLYYAADAYACLTSVPFQPGPALRLIDHYTTTMQFQSTLAHLKNPPQGYQQPAFDLMGGLEELKRNVTGGVFTNEYEFEAALQQLVYAVHDAHVDISAGILSVFSFASPVPLVSASIDGKEAPKIYLAADVISRRDNITEGLPATISAVSHINGEPAEEFLARYGARQSVGMLEPHADWNELMDHPVQDVQGVYSIFGGLGTFYPGDSIKFTFEGDEEPWESRWLAIYNIAEFTGPLVTSGDFYNYFVLGLVPASYNDVPLPEVFGGSPAVTDDQPTTGETPADGEAPAADGETDAADGAADETAYTSWYEDSYGAFPEEPDVKQEDLGPYGGGVLTGYFYDDISTAVLSVPHFNQYGTSLGTFSTALAAFVTSATERGLSRIVIDVQKNYGGSTGIALLLFREFFPGVEPYAASQRRSHELGNILGSATTQYWDELIVGNDEQKQEGLELVADEWVIKTRLNAETGQNFTSWEEYQGPRRQNDDDFSLVERYDMKNPTFQTAAFDGWQLNRYLDNNDAARTIPWKPKDIVILTDGTCSSACALFVEMATKQGGARTVTMGGSPKPGPMQAASGSRGARLYSSDLLDIDFNWIGDAKEALKGRLPANRNDTGIFVNHANFNLRDQLREDDTSTPLQFRYAPADCRLYFTVDNVYNMTAQWYDAARAAFEDPSLCVEGSTGLSAQDGTEVAAPVASDGSPVSTSESPLTFTIDYDPSTFDGLQAADLTHKDVQYGPCPGTSQCVTKSGTSSHVKCRLITFECSPGYWYEQSGCAPLCVSNENALGCAPLASTSNTLERSTVAPIGSKQYPGGSVKARVLPTTPKQVFPPPPPPTTKKSTKTKGSVAKPNDQQFKPRVTGYKRPARGDDAFCSRRNLQVAKLVSWPV